MKFLEIVSDREQTKDYEPMQADYVFALGYSLVCGEFGL